MSARLFYSSQNGDETFDELSLVALNRAFIVPDNGRTLPAGAIGTVVGVSKPGAIFVVEFAEPFAALVDLASDHLAAIPGESRDDLVARQLARRAS